MIFQYPKNDTLIIDSISVLEFGLNVFFDGIPLEKEKYTLNTFKSQLIFSGHQGKKPEKIKVSFYNTPLNLNQSFIRKSDSIIFTSSDSLYQSKLFSIETNNNEFDFFSESQLSKQGSISRGVSVGNAQNLSFQSTLNLQLNGKIGPDLFIKGSISDDNIPFQPDGNTQKLQEFDQVFLEIYNDDFSVTGGDFWLRKPEGYFLNYQKRSQGLSLGFKHGSNAKSNPIITHKVSGAFSRGKFARNIVQGIEGNQGAYRLFGAENEQNIIILAGTEKVYIDGILLQRGQAFDYTIDYNGAEITFTANQLITKDKRIIVEFQYSDLNYARSLLVYNTTIKAKNYEVWGNIYNEQDAKNQPIQQSLNLEQKNTLSLVGDNIEQSFISSIIPTEFIENNLHYYLVDSLSLGIDSILVFTNNPDSAMYRATFAFVGKNNGNYIIDRYTANGKIYKWIAPIEGTPRGEYEPVQLLVPPKQNQMINIGGRYRFNDQTSSEIELAYSKNDQNTFSKLDQDDDKGYGLKWALENSRPLNADNRSILGKANFEFNTKNFVPIQWFRSAEFDRDWNVRQKNYEGDQYISSFELAYQHNLNSKLRYSINQLTWGNDYSGWKNDINLNINNASYLIKFDGNYLVSNGLENSNYSRHQSRLVKKFKTVKIGLTDIFERNKISDIDGILSPTSFQFYDIKSYLSIGDSSKNYQEIYYQQRHDWFSDSVSLKHAARADNFGITSQFLKQKAHQLKINLNYRVLEIIDTSLIDQNPEQTILGRIEQNLFLLKGFLTSRVFYELNSGLELKRDFVYIQVNNGQGIYTWIDYNEDGIKDIGEFEIAQFADQAEYIRVNIATTDFVRTYGNQFSQTIFIKPERLWRNQNGMKGFIAKLSNQTNYNINRKTSYEDGFSALNPFNYNISDTSLINSLSTLRNTLYYNRLNPVFGLEYNYQINSAKNLLSNGFDANNRTLQSVKLRWNISKIFNVKLEYNNSNRISSSDYASNRNYNYQSQLGDIILAYQSNTSYRFEINSQYVTKVNNSDLNEEANIFKLGGQVRINQAKKGSFSANFSANFIQYNADENTPLAFELLESLKSGTNYIWGVTYQRKIANNLQLNFNYNGRKSEEIQSIHSGGMELRAFF